VSTDMCLTYQAFEMYGMHVPETRALSKI
jgi:hypothetical protein